MINSQQETAKPGRPYWGGFATLAFGSLIAIAFFIVQMVIFGIFVEIRTSQNLEIGLDKIFDELANNGFVLSVSTYCTTLICVFLIFLFIKLKRDSFIKDYLDIKWISIKELFPWIIVTSLFLLLYDLTTIAIGRPIVPEFMPIAYKSAKILPFFWGALIIMAPVSEELFFRGFLFQGFKSSFLKPAGAILFTSFLWAIIHTQYDAYDISAIFIMGIILGVARMKTGSILTAIFLHAFMNIVATIETAIVI